MLLILQSTTLENLLRLNTHEVAIAVILFHPKANCFRVKYVV
ncbi:hypothetical protein SynA1528_00521 [Synechococcus sp. A15-28]|nr:hypothetical protein SynA1528_00521 [Synechococcus sp. A15-28]